MIAPHSSSRQRLHLVCPQWEGCPWLHRPWGPWELERALIARTERVRTVYSIRSRDCRTHKKGLAAKTIEIVVPTTGFRDRTGSAGRVNGRV